MRAMLAGLAAVVGCTPFTAPEEVSYERSVGADREAGVVRVATWNIEDVGTPGSSQYDAAVEVLERIDVDVLGLNEIQGSWDVANAEQLAADLDYPYVIIGDATYGSDRNAIFSRYPFLEAEVLDAAALSGDDRAADITRDFVRATIDAPSGVFDLVSMHWKSGWEDEDEFRRVLEGHRAASLVHDEHPVILSGDWNDDLDDQADFPARFDSLPAIPSSFWIGGDLWNELQDEGFANDPFAPLFEAGLDILEPLQRSGTDASRPVSGRRLDYFAVTLDLEVRAMEIYDCHDEGRPGDLAYAGSALGWDTCDDAADHLPVVMDIFLGGLPQQPADPIGIDELEEGQLVFSELLANPDACSDSDGEWIELRNTTDRPIELVGLELVDASGNIGTVSDGLIGPGAVAVLGRGESPCGIDASATYSTAVSLNNGGDSLGLWAGSVLLDSVTYTGSAVDPDISWGSDGDTWCQAEPTPGVANASCG